MTPKDSSPIRNTTKSAARKAPKISISQAKERIIIFDSMVIPFLSFNARIWGAVIRLE